MGKTTKTVEKFRKADTGEYTTKKYADNHPKTTVKETDKIVIKKSGKQ